MKSNVEDLKGDLAQAEAALQKCHKLAVASQYAGATIHEVNNPLEAIANLIYLIKLEASDPAKVAEHATLIEKQLDVLTGITRHLLSFHKEQLFAKDFDVVDLMESALKLHQPRFTKGDVALVRDFGAPATASIFGAEILQVISNLLLNALDALPKRNAQLRIKIRTGKESVHITVADNGSGMHPEVFKHLFEPYRTTKPDGTGLGLWLSKGIVDKHKGRLAVHSSQTAGREGTTFRLSIPIKSVA